MGLRQQERYRLLKTNGLCTRCKGETRPGRTECAGCATKRADSMVRELDEVNVARKVAGLRPLTLEKYMEAREEWRSCG